MARKGPSHTTKKFKAQHIFTDREEFQEALANALKDPQGKEDYRILNYHGMGGQGKTALCEQFTIKLKQEKEKNKNLACAKLNFAIQEQRQQANALLQLRLQLADACKIPFPAFDTAFARYFAYSHPGQSIKEKHPSLFNYPSDILQDMEGFTGNVIDEITHDVIKEIPGAGLIYKNLSKLNSTLKIWWQQKGVEILNDLDSLDQHKLLEQLPKYLGADIYDWLFNKKAIKAKNTHQVVILLDTYEALWKNETIKKGIRSTSVDAWLRKLVEETPGVLYIILGREKLNWAEIEPDWEPDIQSHLLGSLSNEDANDFLMQVPIGEYEIRKAITRSSQGVPFYLDLQVDLYESLKQNNTHLDVSNFGGAEIDILARFTSHISERADLALRIASYPRFLNVEILQQLADEFLQGKASITINELCDYTFWRKQKNIWKLHELMRDYLQEREYKKNESLFNQAHQFLFKIYDSKLENLKHAVDIEVSHAIYLAEASYHLQQFDLKKFPEWANLRGKIFGDACAFQDVQPIWETALKISEEQFGKDHIKTALLLNNLAETKQAQGIYEEAENFYFSSIKIYENTLGNDHPSLAVVLNNLARLHKMQGYYEKAKNLYKRSLLIKEKEKNNTITVAATLNNLAELYREQGKYQEAKPLYLRSLVIREKELGKDHTVVAESLTNLASFYVTQGNYDKAEPLLQKALNIMENKKGNYHPDIAIILSNLAGIYIEQDKYEDAEIAYKRSLSIYEKTLGKNHLYVGIILNNLADLYLIQNKYEKVEHLFNRSLDIHEQVLGSNHLSIGMILNNLAELYKYQGKYKKAEPLYQRSLKINEKSVGKIHPEVARSLNNFADFFLVQEKYEEAESLYNEAICIMEKIFPEGHPHIELLTNNVETLKNKKDNRE